MNKEQTHYNINKLIKQYEKMANNCSSQWDNLNENQSSDPERSQLESSEMSALIAEIDLLESFIDDLKSLKEEE
jgi:hypothetical protein